MSDWTAVRRLPRKVGLDLARQTLLLMPIFSQQ